MKDAEIAANGRGGSNGASLMESWTAAFVPWLRTFLLSMTVIVMSDARAADPPERAIGILYDDSGSMNKPQARWVGANFSIQVMAALLADTDELFLSKMNASPRPRRTAIPQGVDSLLRALQQEPQPDGNTPYEGVGQLLEVLRQSTARQKWLIVATDGNFSDFQEALARTQIEQVAKPNNIRVVFVLIERDGSFDAARYWEKFGGATLVEATKASQVPARMETVAAMLTGRDPSGLSVTRNDRELVVDSKFPLRGLVVLTQGDAPANIESATTGNRTMTVRTHDIKSRHPVADIPRFANVAHLAMPEAIASGEKVATIRFTAPLARQRVKIFPDVAAKMDVVLVAPDGKPLAKGPTGQYRVCREDGALLRTRLVGSDGKPITVGRQDIATFDVGYETLSAQTHRSSVAQSQEYFDVKLLVKEPLHIIPFARYPGYFSYRGNEVVVEPIACRREVVVSVASLLNADGGWLSRVDELDLAPPIRFKVTIDGTSPAASELSAWLLKGDATRAWDVTVGDGEFALVPKSACCAWTWRRPKAHAGRIEYATWGTGNPGDHVVWPSPVPYSWTLPPDAVPRLWWLYGCPIATWMGIALLGWYVLRLLQKERFARKSVVHVRTGRLVEPHSLVRGRNWFSRWLWPAKRETRQIANYRFVAIGRGGGAVLVDGRTLGDRDEIMGWQFDSARQARKQAQMDARLRDKGTIQHRHQTQTMNRRYDKELQYSAGGKPAAWPD